MLSGTTLALTRARRTVLRHRRLLAFAMAAMAAALLLHAVRPPAPATTTLTVAAHDLPAGTILSADDLATLKVPPGDLPNGSLAAPQGRILAAPLRRGEPVTDLRLVGPALTATDPALVALPVRFPDAGMAGLLQVGDRIRLLSTNPSTGATRTVADRVGVLGLPDQGDQDPAQSEAESGVTNTTQGRLVVVGVSDDLVTTVTSAAVGGFLTFAYDH